MTIIGSGVLEAGMENAVYFYYPYLSERDRIRLVFITNATIYNETFIKLIKQNKVSLINVSLDSGTKETYKKIKKANLFDKAVDNLIKYSNEGCNIFLKYLILPGVNDNNADIDGFFEIVLKTKANVIISANFFTRDKDLPPVTMELIESYYIELSKQGIGITFMTKYFTKRDRAVIEKMVGRGNEKVKDYKSAIRYINELEVQLGEEREALNKLYCSNSWKITKPLRYIKNVLYNN